MSSVEYNARKITALLRSMQVAFVIMSVTLASLLVYFAFLWQRALHADVAYFVACNGTQAAYKRSDKPRRDHLEIEHFTSTFLQNAFAHSEFTYKDHLSAALLVMERKSGLFLKSKFSQEALEEVYKLHSGISTVSIDKIQINTKDYPYEVAAFYQTTLHFVGERDTQSVQSGVYFQLTHVPRSPENPYGLLITDFQFIAHDDA